MITGYLISTLAIVSGGLAFLRPTIWACFAAFALNATAVWWWWPILITAL